MNMQEYKELIQVPLGEVPADKLIINGQILNVYSGKIQSGLKLAIKGNRIAYIGESDVVYDAATEIIDAAGLFLIPGYIDPHGHSDFSSNPIALAREVLPRGTTAIFSDTKSIAAALGSPGIRAMLDMTEQLPIRFFFAVPAANPIFPHLEGEDSITPEEFTNFINNPRVLGVSELVAWRRVIDLDEVLLRKLDQVRRLGKRIEGHAAGCSPEKLNALVNAGITSCHESITVEEVRQRVNLGLYTMLRHGSIRSDLPTLARILVEEPELDTRWLMLTPDWVSPGDIMERGYMDHLVKEAIRYGIPPVKAVQMATINPAQYLGLDRVLGGLGPSRYADILFIEDPTLPTPVKVMVNGKVIAENGMLQQDIPFRFPETVYGSWRQGRVPAFQPKAEHFIVKATAAEGHFETVPVLKIVNRTITKMEFVQIPVKSGQLSVESTDLLKISMLHRDGDRFVTAFLSGFGGQIGGLATSLAHDHHTPYVIGNNDRDMALAFNRMLEIDGGIVLVDEEIIRGECPLVIGGIMSDRDMRLMEMDLRVIEQFLLERGCKNGPLVTLDFLSHTGVPFVRITPSGLYDVRRKEILFPLTPRC
jgi:adenine deaminase